MKTTHQGGFSFWCVVVGETADWGTPSAYSLLYSQNAFPSGKERSDVRRGSESTRSHQKKPRLWRGFFNEARLRRMKTASPNEDAPLMKHGFAVLGRALRFMFRIAEHFMATQLPLHVRRRRTLHFSIKSHRFHSESPAFRQRIFACEKLFLLFKTNSLSYLH
jgi:hypothetical protein